MYDDDWKPVMTAPSMEQKVEAFAQLAEDRAEQRDQSVEDIVHDLMHESYLLKHTTGDVLQELKDLEETYPDALYDGEANDHIMQNIDDLDADFWYDYVSLSLVAGLEWAVLREMEDSAETVL